MIRDYKSRKSAKNRKGGNSLLLALFIGYTLGLASAIGVWLYISQTPSPYLNEGKIIENQISGKSVQPSPQTKNAAMDTNLSGTDKPRFDFYKILPGIDEPAGEDVFDLLSLPPDPITSTGKIFEREPEKIPEKTPEPKDPYYLQAGSFRNSSDAEKMKAELALLGIVASVQTGRSQNNALLHRVRIGPFTRMEKLDRVRALLQENGITSSLARARNDTQ